MLATILSCLLLLADAPAMDLNGKIVGPDGSAVSGATVIVYNATPKKGSPTTNPSEDVDCQKFATSDASGAFDIAGVDSSKTFQLMVVSDAFRPLLLKKVDPAGGLITAKLKALPADVDPQMLVRGRVVDSTGNPIPAAKIEINSYSQGTMTSYGGEESVIEPSTYTNAKGEFTLIAKQADPRFNLLIHARQAATTIVKGFAPGDDIRETAMTNGAKVTGRMIKDGQPLAGIKLNIIQTDRLSETFLGIDSTYTDETGRFTFAHVHPDTRFDLTATTKSLAGRGYANSIPCTSTGDDTVVDAGDIALEAGLTVSGQLVCPSGSPDWSAAKVRIERGGTWDDPYDVSVDKDGHFQLKGLGSDIWQLSVRLDNFHLSKDNASVEPYRASYLLGRVDDNISDLKIQLDPGPADTLQHSEYNQAAWEALQRTRLGGIEPKQ